MYVGIWSDYIFYSEGEELRKMTWKGAIFLSVHVHSHRIIWAVARFISKSAWTEQFINVYFSEFFYQNDCKIILLMSFLSILFYEVNVRGHLPGEAVSLHKFLMYVELGIHCFHIFSLWVWISSKCHIDLFIEMLLVFVVSAWFSRIPLYSTNSLYFNKIIALQYASSP